MDMPIRYWFIDKLHNTEGVEYFDKAAASSYCDTRHPLTDIYCAAPVDHLGPHIGLNSVREVVSIWNGPVCGNARDTVRSQMMPKVGRTWCHLAEGHDGPCSEATYDELARTL